MTPEQISAAAKALARAWTENTLAQLPAGWSPSNRQEAFAIQDALIAELNEPVGAFKVGATSPAVRRLDNHDGAVPGIILASQVHLSPVQLPSRYHHAKVEGEFALLFQQDLPAKSTAYSQEEIAAASIMTPAVELVGSRLHQDMSVPSTLEAIADNGNSIGFVFGKPYPQWQSLDLASLKVTLTINDNPPQLQFLGDDRCQPLSAAQEAIQIFGQRSISIKKGQYLSTGAVTLPQSIKKGDHIRVDFGALGQLQINL